MSETSAIFVANAKETQRFAAILAPLLQNGDSLLLAGEMGAGKTYFAAQLIPAIMKEAVDVTSPTFTLQHLYEVTKNPAISKIVHMDLYRVESEEALLSLGIEEYLNQDICIIEWPDRLGQLAPNRYIYLQFNIIDADTREIILHPSGNMQHVVKQALMAFAP